MKNHLTAFALGVSLLSGGSSQAGTIFSEDFSDELAANGGNGSLNYTGFDQFSVSNGTVDLISSGEFGITCATGGCVDLDGTSSSSGLLSAPLNFLGGVTYTISAWLSGNQQNGATEIVEFGITGLRSETVVLAPDDEFSEYGFSFSFPRDTTASLFFQDQGNDQVGGVLDRVSIFFNAAAGPDFTKEFVPDDIVQGVETVLTFTIDNSANAIEATGLTFTDPLDSGVFIAADPNASSTCGGTVDTSDSSLIAFSGGTVAAGGTCEIVVTLQAFEAGSFDNITSTLTSSLEAATAAEDTLTIDAFPLVLSMGFFPEAIEQFQTSTVTYSFQNNASIAATGITLTDVLPAGVTIASPEVKSKTCTGGMVDAPAGGTTISYVGGELDPGLGCSISVEVTSEFVGTYPDTTESATSSLGTSANADATLTVDSATTGTVTIVQNTDTDGDYAFTSTEPGLTFAITTASGTGTQGPITLTQGRYSVSQRAPNGVGNTAITCNDGNSSGNARERTISINLSPLENVTCTITSISSLQKTVHTINRFLTKRADLILSSEPRSGRRLDRLNRGFGTASQLSFTPGDLRAMVPFTAEISRSSNEYRFSTSMLQVREAAASIALAHGSTKDAMYVENYQFDAWFEAQYKKFDSGTDGEGHFAIAYLGADYLVTPDMLVGVMLQIDDMEDVSTALNTTASGTGWMVGPYMTARLAPNLYFDGRIAAGKSENEVSPFNTYVDDFQTDRWLAMASITGDFQRGKWTIRPAASLSYFEETQESYIDGIGVTIPSQTVKLGQLKLGPTFTGRFETENGMLYSPYFSVDAIYNIGDTTGVTVTNPDTPATDGWRGRLQAGVDLTTDTGTRISFGGTYDGLFRSDFASWGVLFDITIPLKNNKAR